VTKEIDSCRICAAAKSSIANSSTNF